MKKIVSLLLCLAIMTFGMSAFATDAFPSKSITVTIPWAAGGAVDLFVRQIANAAEGIADVPFVVQNNTGAAGTVAATQYLNEKNDGYSVLVCAVPVLFYQPHVREVIYTIDDFKPIVGLHKSDVFLVVSAKSGIETLDDFKKAAEGANFTWASAGTGTIDWVAQQTIAGAIGVIPNNVPYDNAAEQVTAIVGGNLDAACVVKGSFEEYVKSGDLNVIACLAETDIELEGIGTVPCLKTLGFDSSAYNFYFITGLAGTDDAVVQKIYEIFDAAIKTEEVQAYIDAMQFDMNVLNPADMNDYFAATYVAANELFAQ